MLERDGVKLKCTVNLTTESFRKLDESDQDPTFFEKASSRCIHTIFSNFNRAVTQQASMESIRERYEPGSKKYLMITQIIEHREPLIEKLEKKLLGVLMKRAKHRGDVIV